MKSTGYIDSSGVYHKRAPNLSEIGTNVTSVDKQYHHDRQRESHRRDILQPHKNGQPNGEFIRTYPEEAQSYFSPEQIERFGNE